MGLSKQLLLGSAAVLTAAAGAQAADLPSRKAAPVQYVRICDAYGAGFFYIPGTDTCVRLGGYLRAEYEYNTPQRIISASTGLVSQVASAQDSTGTEMRGRIDVDARTQTNYGTLQTVIELRGANADGIRAAAGVTNFGTSYTPAGNSSSALTMERAYIRFAGITAGVSSENYSFMPSNYTYSSNSYAGFPNGMKQLVYTATFGGGFSTTFGIETKGEFGYTKSSGIAPSPSTVPTGTGSWYESNWDGDFVLVGNIRDDQSWGFVAVGAVADNNSAGCSGTTVVCTSTYNSLVGPTMYGGWAVDAALKVNLPMIAPGDEFDTQVEYGQGFLGALLSTGGLSNLSDSDNRRMLGGVERQDSNLVPTSVNTSGQINSFGETTGWVVFGIFTHYWTPEWRSHLALGYTEFNPPTVGTAGTPVTFAGGTTGWTGGSAGLNTQWGRGDLFQATVNLFWSPIKNFDIGLDATYLHLQSQLQNPSAAFLNAGEPGLSESNVIYHLRLSRTF